MRLVLCVWGIASILLFIHVFLKHLLSVYSVDSLFKCSGYKNGEDLGPQEQSKHPPIIIATGRRKTLSRKIIKQETVIIIHIL